METPTAPLTQCVADQSHSSQRLTCQYRVEHYRDCMLVFGSVPLSHMGQIMQLLPEESVVCPRTASLSQAVMAAGLPAALNIVAAMHREPARMRYQARFPQLGAEAIDWLVDGERGQSSDAIFQTLHVVQIEGESATQHPRDLADWRRCQLLLEKNPSLATQMGRMAPVSATWERLTRCWPAILESIEEEVPDWRTNKRLSMARKANALLAAAVDVQN